MLHDPLEEALRRRLDLLTRVELLLEQFDRLLVIRTYPYEAGEIKEILKIRAETEGLTVTEKALEHLAHIGSKTSLRYAVQLLTPANHLAETNGKSVNKSCFYSVILT